MLIYILGNVDGSFSLINLWYVDSACIYSNSDPTNQHVASCNILCFNWLDLNQGLSSMNLDPTNQYESCRKLLGLVEFKYGLNLSYKSIHFNK